MTSSLLIIYTPLEKSPDSSPIRGQLFVISLYLLPYFHSPIFFNSPLTSTVKHGMFNGYF